MTTIVYQGAGTRATRYLGASTSPLPYVGAGILFPKYTTTITAPTYVAATAFASGTGAISVDFSGTGRASGDVLLLAVESANQSVTTPTGWTLIDTQSTGTAGAAGAVRLTCFYKIASGSETTVSIADSGDHTTAAGIVVRGVDTTSSPINVEAGTTHAATTSWSLPGVTTTIDKCMIVHMVADDRDSTSTSNLSSYSNSNLSSITERVDATTSSGAGGGIQIVTAFKDTAGATGNTSATHAASNTYAAITVALKSISVTTVAEDGAAVPWTPDMIPSLLVWLDASVLASIHKSGTAVSQWDSQVNGLSATGDQQPNYSATGLNGLPTIDCTGDFLYLRVFSMSSLPQGTAASTIATFSYLGSINFQTVLSWGEDDGNRALGIIDGIGVPRSGEDVDTGVSPTSTGDIVVATVGTDANTKVWINGTKDADTTPGAYATSGTDFIVGPNAPSQDHKLSDVFVFSEVLSDTNRQKLEGYLAWKWNKVSTLPSGHPYKSAAPTT